MYQKGQVDMQKLRHQVLISHPLEKNIFGKRVMCIRKTKVHTYQGDRLK